MPVQIHITGDNAAEAIKEFAILSAAFSAAPAAGESKTASKGTPTVKPTKQPDPVKQPDPKPEPEKKTDDPTPQTDDASKEPPEPTLEELRAKASAVAKAKGPEVVKGLLEKFELSNISSVPKEARGAFMVELQNV